MLLNRRETSVTGYRQFWTYIYNENFNFVNFTPVPGSGSPLSAGWRGAQWLSPTPITDHDDSVIEVDYQRFVAGVRGDLTEAWSWDVSYQYSHSDGDYTDEQIFNDAIEDNWFNVGSCVGTVSSVRGVPCVDGSRRREGAISLVRPRCVPRRCLRAVAFCRHSRSNRTQRHP